MIYTREELLAIEIGQLNDILIPADDIYSRLVYNGNEFIPISSLSKLFASKPLLLVYQNLVPDRLAGRLYMGDPEIITAMSKLIGQTTSNLTAVSQYATIEAPTGPQDSVKLCVKHLKNVSIPSIHSCEVPVLKCQTARNLLSLPKC